MSKNQQLPFTTRFVITRDALLYSIENNAYILGYPMSDDQQPSKHQLMDVGQEGNVDVVTRVLDLAYSECQNVLFPHIIQPDPTDDFGDDKLREVSEYEFALKLPAYFPPTSISYLKKLIHEFMVCRAMFVWLGLNNMPAKTEWEMRTEEVTKKMRETLVLRSKKIRRSLHPF